MDAPWIAVTVERPGTTLDDAGRQRLDEAMKLAQSLGAETQTLTGTDLPAELLRFAKFENVTQIVVGRPRGSFFSELLGRSLPYELVHRTQDIAIHLVTKESEAATKRSLFRWPSTFQTNPWNFLFAAVAVTGALAVGKVLTTLTPIPNLSMVFLLAVLVTAMNVGMWPAIFASILSFLVYNFFFIPPIYTFTIAEPYELLALVIFLVVAVISSAMAGRVREQARIAAARMRAMRRLYEFTKRLSGLATIDAVAEGAASEIHASLGRPVVVMLGHDNDDLALTAAWPPEDSLDAAATTAARWAYSHNEPAGADTGTLPIIPWYFVPLRIGAKTLGVAGVAKEKDGPPLDSEARALLDTLVEQTAAALERASLAREMVSAKTATETERVRNTLLASVSHDFRTPLSSILGSATSLIDYGDKLDPAATKDLLRQIKTEAEDLDEMVRNLLAITRIDAGALELRRDWIDLREISERVVSTARRHGAQQRIEIELPKDLTLVKADATLAEQAIGNVVANAVVHTAPDDRVVIDAGNAPDAIALRVTDNGPGIPSDDLPHIFEKFVKGKEMQTLSADGGHTGLGLAIAKGIMEAHGGAISAESPVANGRGARFILTFPRNGAPS